MSDKKLLMDCYNVLIMEYGDKWKNFSDYSLLKQTIVNLRKELGIENE
mgnify:FL=1